MEIRITAPDAPNLKTDKKAGLYEEEYEVNVGILLDGGSHYTDLGTKPERMVRDAIYGETSGGFHSGLLAPALRWISKDKRMVVFERPPMIANIEYYPVKRDEILPPEMMKKTLRSYEVPIPWTVYLVYFDAEYTPVETRVYARNSPLQSMKSEVGLLPILNLYGSSKLCNPIFEKYEAMEPTIANGFNSAYNAVWNSGFNFDLMDAVTGAMQAGVPFPDFKTGQTLGGTNSIDVWFKYWSKLSLADVLTCEWPIPGQKTNGGYAPYATKVSLTQMIEVMRGELKFITPEPGREFLVQLLNDLT